MGKNGKRKNEENHPANNPPKQEKGPWWLFYQSSRAAGFTAWVAVFTFCVAIIAGVQLCVFIQSEKAFVYPTTANFTAGPLVAEMPDTRLYIILKNSGKGTATIEEFNAAIAHSLMPKPTYHGEGIVSQQFTFPPVPNGVEILQPLTFESRWHESTTNAVKAGTMGFYLYGKFKYHRYSLFDSNESGFCFVFDRQSSDSTKSVFRNCVEREYTYTK